MGLKVRVGLLLYGRSELKLLRNKCIELDDEGKLVGVGASCGLHSVDLGTSTLLMPPLCNGHVHVLDLGIADRWEGYPLETLVQQPRGLKYKYLAMQSIDELVEWAYKTLKLLEVDGVGFVGAYVEEGFRGSLALAQASKYTRLRVRILAQPASKSLVEAIELANYVGGLGLDTPFDYGLDAISRLRMLARGYGVHIHVHVSEDIVMHELRDHLYALELGARAAIHGTHLDFSEAEQLLCEGIWLVVCPRSNILLARSTPPLELAFTLWRTGYRTLALGTDNAGWVEPSITQEIATSYLLLRSHGIGAREAAETLLYMATLSCAELLGFDAGLEEGTNLYALIARHPAFYVADEPQAIVKRLVTSQKVLVEGVELVSSRASVL